MKDEAGKGGARLSGSITTGFADEWALNIREEGRIFKLSRIESTNYEGQDSTTFEFSLIHV